MRAVKRRRTAWLFGLAAICILAAGLRCILAVFAFASTRDTSVVGVMGLHILEGARPLFYYGQAYMGALEPYLTALVFFFFGASPETLTVVPVVFTVAWCVASALLFRHLFGTAGGIAAAFCVACAGLYTAWYTTGAYGGYPETYFLGTAAMLLALRKTEKDDQGSAVLWPLMGLIYGVGLWINLQILPYLLVATAIIVFDWLVTNRSMRRAGAIASLGVFSVLGLVPGMIVSREIAGMEHMGVDLALIPANASLLLTTILPRFLFWPQPESILLRVLVAAALTIAVVVYGLSLWRYRKDIRRFVPLLFVAAFLMMYLPHPMASKIAPRYLIAPAMMLIGAGFAAMVTAPWKALRLTGWGIVALWSAYNCTALLLYSVDKHPDKLRSLAIRERVVEAARNAGMKNIKILGGVAEGLLGANFSFAAGDSVRFIAPQDDRILVHHLSWHADAEGGYAFRDDMRRYVRGSLRAMAIDKAHSVTDDFFTLLLPPPVQHIRQYSIDYEIIDTDGGAVQGTALGDNTISTGIDIAAGSTLTLTLALDEEKNLSGMRLFPMRETLPEGPFSIAVSTDNIDYAPIMENEVRLGASYVSGNRLFLMDHYPAQDYQWRPRPARYVRLSFANTNRNRVPAVAELLLFAYGGPQGEVTAAEVSQMQDYLHSQGITFAWCDRWLSNEFARSNADLPSDIAVLPPPNLRYYATMPSRDIVLREDHGIIVANSAAEPCRRTIAAALTSGIQLKSRSFAHYTVFIIVAGKTYRPDPSEPGLMWNGHTVLKKRESI